MKKGFNLLIQRPIKDNFDITSIEKKIGVEFPQAYRSFLTSFYVGEGNMNVEQIYHNGRLFSISPIYYKFKENLEFVHFIDIELSISLYHDFVFGDSNFGRIGFYPIGASGYSLTFFLGVNSDNADEIYSEIEGTWTFLCKDIFEFIRGLHQYEPNKDYMQKNYGVTLPQLYKNWGEDFWRVREKE